MKQAKFIRFCIKAIRDWNVSKFIIPIAIANVIFSVANGLWTIASRPILVGIVVTLFAIQVLLMLVEFNQARILKWLYGRMILKEEPKYVYVSGGYSNADGVICSDEYLIPKKPKELSDIKIMMVYNMKEFVVLAHDNLVSYLSFVHLKDKMASKWHKEVYIKPIGEFNDMVKAKVEDKTDLALFALKPEETNKRKRK